MKRYTYKKGLLLLAILSLSSLSSAQKVDPIKFGDFEQWVTRDIKESAVLGGQVKRIYEIAPNGRFDGQRAYRNMGGSPWATSNVMAKPSGIVKTNNTVYPAHHGNGLCAKLCTQMVECKAAGVINISVLAGGSIFLGELVEPVTSTKGPMSKMAQGIPFTRRPKALRFDYKFATSGAPNRIRETGFSKRTEVAGADMGEVECYFQKRWEDADGSLHALRVGTMRTRFSKSTNDWLEAQDFTIHYGDITKQSFYRDYMGLNNDSRAYYGRNSKGKVVKIIEEGWADPDETPTHVMLRFTSSHGDAYIGSIGNTLWVDNIAWVF